MGQTTQLKVCGMRDADNILQVAALRPAYMGFIFYEKSPRFVGEGFVLPAGFPADIKKVGVFVNASAETMLATARRVGLDALQLHGHESVEVCRAVKAAGLEVIKVFSVDDDVDFTSTEPFKEVADYFLFDTKGKLYGGNAKTFDWSVLKRYDQQVPFFLSGGLTPANVAGAMALEGVNLYALDVNSGVETAPGKKDIALIQELKRNSRL
jgi:phosphoribosylanthranilate isomerase